MNLIQYSEHIEQRKKGEYDNSGPINFERHHFIGQVRAIELKEMVILRQTMDRLSENENYSSNRPLRRSFFDRLVAWS